MLQSGETGNFSTSHRTNPRLARNSSGEHCCRPMPAHRHHARIGVTTLRDATNKLMAPALRQDRFTQRRGEPKVIYKGTRFCTFIRVSRSYKFPVRPGTSAVSAKNRGEYPSSCPPSGEIYAQFLPGRGSFRRVVGRYARAALPCTGGKGEWA